MFNSLKGDKVLWGILALLAIFSFLPVFSASSNLAYVVGKGTPWGYLFKHFVILGIGFVLMFSIHKIPYNYFKGISILMLPVVMLLLLYTASQGTVIDGANASRWIRIPIIGLSFQTSTLASVIAMIYTARYFSKHKDKKISFKSSLIELWLPIFIVVLLIFPSNLSTAALLFLMVLIVSFVAGYPIKYLLTICGTGLALVMLFFLLIKSFPGVFPNRVDTWMSRIENFSSGESADGNYQVERAKTAIVTGKIFGVGAGKSRMKNFLPQSSSDFIYAIIVEEFGLIGGIGLIILYLLLLFRIVVISYKATDVFGKLVVIGLGIPIIFQAFINMGVALQVLPVTGQTLPMISSGGTSAWMTCIAMGIILSVSAKKNLIEDQLDDEDINESNPISILSETL
ncbi:FtsW/RodA/SpoVE family cell cycle protein [Flavobacteriaceae bacterium]|jgi:cell division protein FtsW|nr:FtsW/RodA/SpoVE family cell cycle protein [Flavobacteriaceae bacterium]MBT5447501.1 FtsW/RodA/SpoVE family cell cycle protein [Flavobacteriaceae bacterium]MDA7736400.1 FtsW/RodA/SpoVE family cell cycle protein [Flavobacteriaceae bacterium]MDA7764618.1 FtsW/RodA/SpoVE family cell cycle protein [Flavobacteriaceae bacterium]MDA9157544.1 FtsW/RodA/SpoVE family cell cycle protein [Flavobacteriaceae bacterium]|tara:strand:- start:7223 stop:8419 length:1197 start_codon:yes stop_codon:yes gene_type:complete